LKHPVFHFGFEAVEPVAFTPKGGCPLKHEPARGMVDVQHG